MVIALQMECVVEETFEPSIQHADTDNIAEPLPFVEVAETTLQTETSSSFPSDNNELTDMTALYDQSSVTNDPQTTDSIDNLLANLTEDNANSLPSGDVGSHFASIHESHNIEFPNVTMDDVESSEFDGLANGVSSAVVPPTELPNGFRNTETAAAVELDAESSASNSPVAIAEDLPNGDNASQATVVDVDAEMVSEDELPAPTQEKVDDAEEVSDEELPGPKLAELPADTEVVSEDELPTPVKRKIDDGYDPGSPTESSEVPEKKSKKDVDGGNY